MAPNIPRCIIVNTIPRSGTNIVLGILHRLGVYTGEDSDWIQPCESFPNGSPHDWWFERNINMKPSRHDIDAEFLRYIENRSIHKVFVMASHGISRPGIYRLMRVANLMTIRMIIISRSRKDILASLTKKRERQCPENAAIMALRRYRNTLRRVNRAANFFSGPLLRVGFQGIFDAPINTVNTIAKFVFEGLDVYPTLPQMEHALDWIIPR